MAGHPVQLQCEDQETMKESKGSTMVVAKKVESVGQTLGTILPDSWRSIWRLFVSRLVRLSLANLVAIGQSEQSETCFVVVVYYSEDKTSLSIWDYIVRTTVTGLAAQRLQQLSNQLSMAPVTRAADQQNVLGPDKQKAKITLYWFTNPIPHFAIPIAP